MSKSNSSYRHRSSILPRGTVQELQSKPHLPCPRKERASPLLTMKGTDIKFNTVFHFYIPDRGKCEELYLTRKWADRKTMSSHIPWGPTPKGQHISLRALALRNHSSHSLFQQPIFPAGMEAPWGQGSYPYSLMFLGLRTVPGTEQVFKRRVKSWSMADLPLTNSVTLEKSFHLLQH